jgi:ubiquinone/menaquinone biosynthesis C-methylase UbiE
MTTPNQPADGTQRFSNRVDNYVRYRPTYPRGVLDILRDETGLTPSSIVADVGSGTGISAELFLQNGNTVYAVEPNEPMRRAASDRLGNDPRFHCIAGTAEATTLANHSVDYVVAAQAFHWFDAATARAEFTRILKTSGWIVLIWNSRRLATTPFLRDYESLLQRYATDYRKVNHRNVDAARLRSFFGDAHYEFRKLYNEQRLDFDGLKGRVLSSSYMPTDSHANCHEMVDALKKIYALHAHNNLVVIEYDTEVYFGHMA